MSSQPNVRQTRSQTRAQQANANLNPGGDKSSNHSLEDIFITSMMDKDGGELRDCAGCDRPNNSERYMVQCANCSHWYHFTCANVNTVNVRSSSFVCILCMPSGVSRAVEPTPSQVSSASSRSSTRRARIDRELQRLEEEKKLLDELNRERIAKERALNERELREKLERGKQFIARKHELLSQQDDEEGCSVRSMHSSQRNAKRTEDWVRQNRTTDASGEIVEKRTTPNADPPVDAFSIEPQGVHPSSTPIKIATSVLEPPLSDDRAGTGAEIKSFPHILGNITIGKESTSSSEMAAGTAASEDRQDNQLSDLPYVDLQPYADLLKVAEVASDTGTVLNTGTIPKINRFGAHCYKRWSVETGELRKQNALQVQMQSKSERRAIQSLVEKHQIDVDSRRAREVQLVNHIKGLQLQQ